MQRYPLFLVLAILVGCDSGEQTRELAEARAENARLRAELLTQLQQTTPDTMQGIADLRMQRFRESRDLRASLLETQVDALKRRGLTDPEAQIKASLAAQTQLLPGPSDKGLPYRFGVEEIVFLREGFVWAPFDEGHYQGYMLLEYEVREGGISWTRHWMRSVP